jgi:hypothetical protein
MGFIMSHARTQIRSAIVTALKGVTAFGNRVYGYKTASHKLLPDATVHTINDEVNHEFDTMDGKEVHILTVAIEIRAKAAADLDDTLDGYCVSVEKKMRTDATFGGLVKQLSLNGTSIETEDETDQENGLATIEYEAWYRVSEGDPETIVG